jgi:hypothetical protein
MSSKIIKQDRHYFVECDCGCGRTFEFVGQLRTGVRIKDSNDKELDVSSIEPLKKNWKKYFG